jgi:hypothetical protein
MDYPKYIKPNSSDEQFTVDLADGSGYEVYYHEKNGYWWYTVTYNDNGCRAYSKTHRLPKELFDQMKQQSCSTSNGENE